MQSSELGAIDILVNNAYFPFQVGPLHELTWENFHRAMEHELVGFYFLCTCVFAGDERKRAGRIIVDQYSRLAQQPLPRMGAYAAAKSALESMANTMAIELGPL